MNLGSGMSRNWASNFVAKGKFFAMLCVLSIMTTQMQAQSRKQAAEKGTPESSTGDVARGKYLVEGVAMCGQCHTPRNSDGTLDRSRWLQGAPVPFAPATGNLEGWPTIAPRIGGNPPASDADMIKLLMTGIWTNGKQLKLPMMPFRMSEADARAVVAYLKSVTPDK